MENLVSLLRRADGPLGPSHLLQHGLHYWPLLRTSFLDLVKQEAAVSILRQLNKEIGDVLVGETVLALMTLRFLLRSLLKSSDDHSVNVIVWRKVCVPRLHVTGTLGDCVKYRRPAINHLETHRFTSS